MSPPTGVAAIWTVIATLSGYPSTPVGSQPDPGRQKRSIDRAKITKVKNFNNIQIIAVHKNWKNVKHADVIDGQTELWVLHRSRRLPSAKVRAFVDFMRDQHPGGELVLQG